MKQSALIVKEDGLIYVNEVPEEPEYCREFKGTDCQGSECHCMLHKIRYDRALASAKETAVLCADQEQARDLVWQFHKAFYKVPPGIYPIPDLQWERKGICCSPMSPNINHHGDCDKCSGYSELAILTLSEQPKGEESQKELIDELIHETFGASLAGREEIAKKFTITRNLKSKII